MSESETRCGFVALIGAPNAGKSTLMNAMVGTKLSIVTHKVQTTRAIVRGIAMAGQSQIVFLDTPGIFAPKRTLDRAMVTAAWGGAADADVVCWLVDAKRGIDESAEAILAKLADVRQPKLLILNKIDTVEPPALLELARKLNERIRFEATFMVSAKTGSGVKDLLAELAKRIPAGPWHYPEDQVSDAPLRALAAEITREKLLLRLHEEVPYEATVETDSWTVKKDGSAEVRQTIFVAREGHRKIMLGKGGATIKAISMAARTEIAEAAETVIHLFLFVKVRENWADDPARYREMGLEFPRS